MALQDLTPQLRTRLNRMERAVGWFVLVATVLLLVGFGYYLRNTALRKGWFKKRVPYFTMVDRATGLRVGDPVMLMGFEVGRITKVDAMPPDYFEYNIYVEFEIMEPHYGYVWTEGSQTKVESDLFGKRVIEVTKGTGGHATYDFHPLEEIPLAELEKLPEPDHWRLALDAYDATGTNIVVPAQAPLDKEVIGKLRQKSGLTRIPVFNLREERKKPTAVWHGKQRSYVRFIPKPNPNANLYWLPAEESVAVSERAEKLISQVEKALPSVFDLTNKINAVLGNSAALASNLNVVALSAQPAAANLAQLAAELRGPGALGQWALGTNSQQNLDATLANANLLLAHSDTNLIALLESFGESLENLASITSNLNAQVQANTNLLGSISQAVVDTDDLVQGLKRHWLLRSAFKDKKPGAPGAPVTSPKQRGP
jgi:ABC-type transporter Mla subunit MlaD